MKAITVLLLLFLTACEFAMTNPPDPEPPNVSIQEYLTDYSDLGNPFAAAVLQTGILDELEPDAVYTMFLPPTAWFEEQGVTKEAFLAQPQLEEIVSYHFLTSRLGDLAIPFEPGTQLPTMLEGQSILLTKEGDTYSLNDTVNLMTLPTAFQLTYEVDVLEIAQPLLPQGITLE